MSLAGLKKQFNKANQFLSEQMGAAEATKLDDQYHELERVSRGCQIIGEAERKMSAWREFVTCTRAPRRRKGHLIWICVCA